jgi:transcriptional regulator GlxA family with amidase domain
MRRVTTHWAYCRTLAARYPAISVEADPIFVRDGHVATSAPAPLENEENHADRCPAL